METIDSRIAALARLDKTPEQVLAHKRAELEEQIRVLQHRTRFERYADWRYKHLELDGADLAWLILSFVFRIVEIGMVSWALLTKENHWIAVYAFLALEVIRLFLIALFGGEDFDAWEKRARRVFMHLSYIPLVPIMPLVILVDIKVLRIGKQDRPGEIESLQNQMKRLTPHEVVPSFYAQGIQEARAELLGDSSELRKAECELRKHLEQIRSSKERFQARLSMAGEDVERVDVLNAAVQRATVRESNLVEALARHEQTIAKTHAILDECAACVGKLLNKLLDQELICDFESKEVGENLAIQKAQEAVNRHVDLVRDRLMQLAAIVSAPPRELASANPEGDMRTFFAHLDKVAEQVATLEAQKAF